MRLAIPAAMAALSVGLISTGLRAQTPIAIDLPSAIMRARAYSPEFLSAGIAAAAAHEDKVQSKAALLPTVQNFTGYIGTQGNGTPEGTFVSANGPNVYDEQGQVHTDVFSWQKRAEYRAAIAKEAAAQAQIEVARRGLVGTVIQAYYALVSAQRHVVNSRRSLQEALDFEDLSKKLEAGGEVAHADVVKAALDRSKRQTANAEAESNVEKAKLGMAVLLFQDFDQPFTVTDDLKGDVPLIPLADLQQAIAKNPDIRAAQSSVEAALHGIEAAKGAFKPTFSVDYAVGIDANRFWVRGPDGRQNFGNQITATMTIPIWDWGARKSKLTQAQLQKQQADLDLTSARRQLNADIATLNVEGQAAQRQLDFLSESLMHAEDNLKLTVLRYQGGEAIAQEVVDAQNAAADARNAQDDGLTRYRLALGAMENLTGRY